MKPVYLVCGVPASGKTWVCSQLRDKYNYIAHDSFLKRPEAWLAALRAATSLGKPVVTECPFGERAAREKLEAMGIKVNPVFVVETPDVVAKRYEAREARATSKANLTRASSITERAKEWNAYQGTSEQVLAHLKGKNE